MNWIEEVYRPWWNQHGTEYGAPKAPIRAPNRWVNDIYKPWRDPLPSDHPAPVSPW
jgi:hypothetical protein